MRSAMGRRLILLKNGMLSVADFLLRPRIAVLADSFAWNGKTYPSLSNVAFAITGTRWNGPKFFGLRDKPSKVVP